MRCCVAGSSACSACGDRAAAAAPQRWRCCWWRSRYGSASGYFQIDASERGVVQRFGRYLAIEQPGHGWRWPWPIESMQKLNVASIQGLDSKALMLTADQSLLQIGWSLQYRINDPVQYLFQVRDPQTDPAPERRDPAARAGGAAHAVGAASPAMPAGRSPAEARERIQQLLDGYRAGVIVTSVSMTDVQLPDAVVATQRDAEKAEEDRQRAIADAQAFANDILPKAQATAQRQLADAQVYAAQTVANADGEAERFTQLAACLRAGAARSRAAVCTSIPWRTSCRTRTRSSSTPRAAAAT